MTNKKDIEEMNEWFAKLGFKPFVVKDNVFREEKETHILQTDHKDHTVDASTILQSDAIKIYQALTQHHEEDLDALGDEIIRLRKDLEKQRVSHQAEVRDAWRAGYLAKQEGKSPDAYGEYLQAPTKTDNNKNHD